MLYQVSLCVIFSQSLHFLPVILRDRKIICIKGAMSSKDHPKTGHEGLEV